MKKKKKNYGFLINDLYMRFSKINIFKPLQRNYFAFREHNKPVKVKEDCKYVLLSNFFFCIIQNFIFFYMGF